jgi:peptidoglycan/LPS O-acetylase OafA/YrhL
MTGALSTVDLDDPPAPIARSPAPARDASAGHARYRADIDGLRAVAVLSVVGFHAFPDSVQGGFIGVDIFFVISGFLISGILFGALEEGRFSLATFYSRRVRRIFGALIVVLAATLAAGWLFFVAGDYKLLGLHVATGAGFVANLLEWHDAGYFANAADSKPLLHLWSLGVEEQFYLTWPLIVYFAWRRRFGALVAIAAILAASFAINVASVRTDIVAAFYAPQSRFWELMLGSLLAYLMLGRPEATPRLGNIAAVTGLALIAAALLNVNSNSAFPGWWAVLPTGGAFLLIAAGSGAWVNRRLLANPGMRWVGLISYPLYLWHWPLLVFARMLQFGAPSRSLRIAVVAASIVLAWLTYELIEKPVRKGGRERLKVAGLCVALALLFAGGLAVYSADGLEARKANADERALFVHYYNNFRHTELEVAYHGECSFYDSGTDRAKPSIDSECVRPGAKATVFLWGDSHAMALSPGLHRVLPDGARLAQVATGACKPSLATDHSYARGDSCHHSNEFARERIAALKPDVVILAQLDKHLRTDWEGVADFIHAAGGRSVVLVGPVPRWEPSLPLVVAKHHWGKPHDRIATGLDPDAFDTDRRLALKYAGSTKLTYVSLASRLCNDEGCLATVPGIQGHNLMAVDAAHLTPEASAFIASTVLRPYVAAQR